MLVTISIQAEELIWPDDPLHDCVNSAGLTGHLQLSTASKLQVQQAILCLDIWFVFHNGSPTRDQSLLPPRPDGRESRAT
ncbi:unnamed protein product [Protopolystoma xenopodis]|uniref:Uncharacterized protein n=1 Tax=Protopolystoma xenopodis TaxID=117903 RepID=A0A3S5C7N4_9PLAT|nr:unnamed protein product [Protopolystoma xenopodis]